MKKTYPITRTEMTAEHKTKKELAQRRIERLRRISHFSLRGTIRNMRVGDSFRVNMKDFASLQSIRVSVSLAAKSFGFLMATKTIPVNRHKVVEIIKLGNRN